MQKMLEMFSRKNVPAKRGPTKQEQQQMSMRSMHPKIDVFQTIFYILSLSIWKSEIVILDSKCLTYKQPYSLGWLSRGRPSVLIRNQF